MPISADDVVPPPAPAPQSPPPGVPTIPAAVKYPLDDKRLAEINDRFEYHPPRGDQPERYNQLRAKVRELALTICQLTPPGREQSTALTHLDAAMMFANAAIARGE